MRPYPYFIFHPPHFPSSIFISPFQLSSSLPCSNPFVLPLRPKVELEIDIHHSLISYSIQLLIHPGGEETRDKREREKQKYDIKRNLRQGNKKSEAQSLEKNKVKRMAEIRYPRSVVKHISREAHSELMKH